MLDTFKRQFAGTWSRWLLISLLFGVVGSITLLLSRAATQSLVVEPVTGIVTGNAATQYDTTASGGRVTKFGITPQLIPIGNFGAVGDGVTDDTAALNTAFTTAPAGTTLVFASGKSYLHNASLHIKVASLHLTGAATIRATNALDSAIQVQADNVTLDGNLTLAFDTAGVSRKSAGWQTMVYVQQAKGTVLHDITVSGSPSAGILFDRSAYYRVDHVLVQDTLADSFHSTNGSHDGTISNCTAVNGADDGFANVSYQSNSDQVHNMTYSNDVVKDQVAGRGFSVVGGNHITFQNISSDGTSSAAIYIASEAGFNTYGVDHVTINGANLNRSNTSQTVSHGAVLVYDSQPANSITDVTLSNITVTNTRTDAPRQFGIIGTAGTGIERVAFINVTITGALKSLGISTKIPLTYNTTNWLVNGQPLPDHEDF